MTIDIGRLEDQLLRMSAEGAPGREFCEAIAELARTGRFAQLQDILPAIVYNELWARYEQDPAGFVAGWQMLAQEMRQGFIQHARQRLTSLTRLQQEGRDSSIPAWQEIQRALDGQQNDLLRAAFAMELLEMVEPAVLRATHLRECVVAAAELGRGRPLPGRGYAMLFPRPLYRLRRYVPFGAGRGPQTNLPASLSRLVRTRYRNAATLGNLLHEVNNNLI